MSSTAPTPSLAEETEAAFIERMLDQEFEAHRMPADKVAALNGDVDMVNNPPHYNGHPSGTEAIEIIEHAPTLCLGNALKYIWRVSWGSKGNDIQDLEKAIFYLQREIHNRNLAMEAAK